jgi:hypothetical protein
LNKIFGNKQEKNNKAVLGIILITLGAIIAGVLSYIISLKILKIIS